MPTLAPSPAAVKPAAAARPFGVGVIDPPAVAPALPAPWPPGDHIPAPSGRWAADGSPIRPYGDDDAAWYAREFQREMDRGAAMADSRRFWGERRLDGHENGYEADVAGLGYRRQT